MNITDKRTTQWIVKIINITCPYIYYPNTDIACQLKQYDTDYFCYEQNCPLKQRPEPPAS